MPETWSAPRTWVNGETVTDTLMNTHVRDNLMYLKGVISGSNLQDILMANDRNLQWKNSAGAAQSVMKATGDNFLNLMPVDATKGIRFMNKAFTQVIAQIIESSYSVLLENGVFRTQRHPYANDRHVESGVVNIGALGSGANQSVAVTFANAFASAPRAVATPNGQVGGNAPTAEATINSVTTTGMNVVFFNDGGVALTSATVGWIAEGQD